jgi:hypothetical protein
MFTSVYSKIYGIFVHSLSLTKNIYNAWDMPFVPRFPLSTTTVGMPGPSKREMFLMKILPPLPPGAIPGNCFHTCIMRVNVGKTNQKKIGMRYHYVSEPSHAHLSISTQWSSQWRGPGDLSRGGKVCDSGMDDVCTGGNKYLGMVCGYKVRGG